MKVFKVESIRVGDSTKNVITAEFYVAEHMNDVIEWLKPDLSDQGIEILAIAEAAPVLAIIPKKVQKVEKEGAQ